MEDKISKLLKYSHALLGTLYSDIDKHESHYHIKSFLKGAFYNFLAPIKDFNETDWQDAEKLIVSELTNGSEVSFYLNEGVKPYFTEKLESGHFLNAKYSEQFDDTYMVYTHQGKLELSTAVRYKRVDESLISEYIRVSTACFPEWNNNVEYCNHFYQLDSKAGYYDSSLYLVYFDGTPIGVCGAVYSLSDKIAYIHNAGVLPEFRLNGYFTEMMRFIVNEAINCGCIETFSIVEEGGGSYIASKKFGFEPVVKYVIFTKS